MTEGPNRITCARTVAVHEHERPGTHATGRLRPSRCRAHSVLWQPDAPTCQQAQQRWAAAARQNRATSLGGRQRILGAATDQGPLFSASAAYKCNKGSVSLPSSATINGTLCFIRPLMKCTSRLRLSSLATIIGAACLRAAARAPARAGRRQS
jgi:hypothetical protein